MEGGPCLPHCRYNSKPARVAWALAIGFALFQACTLAGSAAAPSLTQIMQNIAAATNIPQSMGFSQDIEAAGWLGKWHFSSTVVRDAQGVHVSAPKAPALIPTDFLADLADFSEALREFELNYSGKVVLAGKYDCYLVTGARKPGVYSGAIQGSIWVDVSTFLIRHIQIRYSWGTVDVEQTYEQQKEFTVLSRQDATVKPLPMRLTVKYSDYWFKSK